MSIAETGSVIGNNVIQLPTDYKPQTVAAECGVGAFFKPAAEHALTVHDRIGSYTQRVGERQLFTMDSPVILLASTVTSPGTPPAYSLELGARLGRFVESWGKITTTRSGEVISSWSSMLDLVDKDPQGISPRQRLLRNQYLTQVRTHPVIEGRMHRERLGKPEVPNAMLDRFWNLTQSWAVDGGIDFVPDPDKSPAQRLRDLVDVVGVSNIDRETTTQKDGIEYTLFTRTDGQNNPYSLAVTAEGHVLYTTPILERTVAARRKQKWGYNNGTPPLYYDIHNINSTGLRNMSRGAQAEIILNNKGAAVIIVNDEQGVMPAATLDDAAHGVEVIESLVPYGPLRLVHSR